MPVADAEAEPERVGEGDAELVTSALAESLAEAAGLAESMGAGLEPDSEGDTTGEADAVESELAPLLADSVGAGVASALTEGDGSTVNATGTGTGSADAEFATKGIPRAMTSTLIDPATTETIRFLFDDCMASPKQAAEGGLTIDSP